VTVTAWLPGYERADMGGAGLNVGPGAPKVVLHTTETPQGTANQLINHWRANWGAGLPHFIIDGARVVQLLPLTVGAYTLENAPGGADTNRSGPAIQAEICGYADKDWDDATYTAVGNLLGDIKRAGHDFDLGNHPKWYGANEGIVLASYRSPVRMTAAQYDAFNGWCAHQHVPENAHWDCGRKDTDRLERIARARYGGAPAPTQPTPTPEPEEIDVPTIIRIKTKAGEYLYDPCAGTARNISGDESAVLQAAPFSLPKHEFDAGSAMHRILNGDGTTITKLNYAEVG